MAFGVKDPRVAVLFILGVFLVILMIFIGILLYLSGSTRHYEEFAVLVDEEDEIEAIRLWWPNRSIQETITTSYGDYKLYRNENIAEWSSKEHAITLVTVFSLHTLASFREIVQRWDGPISAILYIPNHISIFQSSTLLKAQFISRYEKFDSLENTRLQIITGPTDTFPYGHFINLAWDIVPTSWAIVWNPTFIPSFSALPLLNTFLLGRELNKTGVYNLPILIPKCQISPLFPEETVQPDFVSINDTFEYFAEENGYRTSAFISWRKFQQLLASCQSKRVPFPLSPIRYDSWFEHAIKSESVSMATRPELYFWGFSSIFITEFIDSNRPPHHLYSEFDTATLYAAQLIQLPKPISSLPFPMSAHQIYSASYYDMFPPKTSLSPLQICEEMKRIEATQFLCGKSADFPCCSAFPPQDLAPIDGEEASTVVYPNWAKLIPNV